MAINKGKGLPPLCRQGSPLRSDPFLRYRSGMDKPLTAFTPLARKPDTGFLRKPCFSFSFSCVPRYPRHGRSGNSLSPAPYFFILILTCKKPERASKILGDPLSTPYFRWLSATPADDLRK